MSTQVPLDLLKKYHPLESLSPSNLNELVNHASILTLSSSKMLFKRMQANQNYYYLLEGTLDLLDSNFKVTKVNTQSPRAKHPLDSCDPYQLSAVTTSEVKVLKVNKDKLDLVLTWDQAGNYLVEDLGDEDKYSENDWMSCLLGSKLFQQIPPANLQQLFIKFSDKPVNKGDRIITEGDQGDTFYVIQKGNARVYRLTENGKQQPLANLGPGQFFGEEALIGNTVRNASVEMTTNGVLMALGKNDFKKLLEEPVVQFVTPTQVAEWKTQGKPLQDLDVRLPVEIPPQERKVRMIITLSELRSHLSDLDIGTTYVLCPEAGRRAVLGAYLLNEAGYKAVVLKE